MIKATKMGSLLTTGMAAAALVLSMTGSIALAEADESALTIHSSPADKDFKTFNTANGAYEVVGASKVPAEWQFGGIVRFTKEKGPLKDWTYWYTEAFYVISGKGKVTASNIPFTSPEEYEMGPGDYTFIPMGTRVSFEALSDEPFVIFYTAPK